jgi:NAD(P)-dependent dehydrogenase (short-subunit alcohol dehydrogenase family)
MSMTEKVSQKNNKHILIVGGTSGIGKIVALSFAKKCRLVSVIGRRKSNVLEKTNIRQYSSDITDTEKLPETIQTILEEGGKISHLIFFQRYRDKKQNWDGELETSLTATKNIIELTIDNFDGCKDKSIVIISSVIARFVAFEQPLSYHVVKAGLNQLVRFYAVSLGKKRLRINSVSPAAVMKDRAKDYYKKNNELEDLYRKLIPLGRIGTPEDIFGVVSFLCSEESIYITGQNIIVDGGLSLLAHEGMIRKIINNKEEIKNNKI